MSKRDSFAGSVLILATGATFVRAAVHSLVEQPNALGVFFCISALATGFLALRSIWRDRL